MFFCFFLANSFTFVDGVSGQKCQSDHDVEVPAVVVALAAKCLVLAEFPLEGRHAVRKARLGFNPVIVGRKHCDLTKCFFHGFISLAGSEKKA